MVSYPKRFNPKITLFWNIPKILWLIIYTGHGQFLNMAELFAEKNKDISKSTLRVFKAICSRWPSNPLEVADELGENGKTKTLSAKYLYHFKKLHKLELINMKKIGNTYIAWPMDMEKLRFLHEMLREE